MLDTAPAEIVEAARVDRTRQQWWRWIVHLGLMLTLVVSLVFETVLTIHIVVGLIFVGLVVAHLGQRRRSSVRLVRRLRQVGTLHHRPGRLALADTLLALLTAAMLISGFWDWIGGQPTTIRWHALTGIALAVLVVAHTLRRRTRLRTSLVS